MINIDIVVPALDMVYDFSVSDEVPVSLLIEEIAEIICQREKMMVCGDGRLAFFSTGEKDPLQGKGTLRDYGVVTGSRLYLV